MAIPRIAGRVGQMTASDTFALVDAVRPRITEERIATMPEIDRMMAVAHSEVDVAYGQSLV